MRKTLICVIAIWFNSFLCVAQSIENYQGNVFINVDMKNVHAEFTIIFDTLLNTDKLKLFVHQSANILDISSNSTPVSFSIIEESFIGDDKAILIDRKGIKNKKLTVQYIYSLDSIKNENFRFNKNWIELNLYTAWFPLNIGYGDFTYDIKVQLPKPYKLIGSGTVSNKGKIWKNKQNIPFLDIPLIISSNLKCISVGKGKIKIYYLTLDEKIKKTIKKSTHDYYSHLSKMLGNSSSGNLVLAVNSFNRSISYSRKEFISLSIENSFKTEDEKTLAHEIAHLWWNMANVNTWEDWLNESFAEYSSIILQRYQYGEKNFNENIKELKELITDLPSLGKLKKEEYKNQETVTYKGAYFLYELENKIGRKSFEQLLNKVYKNKVSSTSEFLSTIEDELGIEMKEYVNNKLNE